jgi:hypothetical protein
VWPGSVAQVAEDEALSPNPSTDSPQNMWTLARSFESLRHFLGSCYYHSLLEVRTIVNE